MKTLNCGVVSPAWRAASGRGPTRRFREPRLRPWRLPTRRPSGTAPRGDREPDERGKRQHGANRPHRAGSCNLRLAKDGVNHKNVLPNRKSATPPTLRIVNITYTSRCGSAPSSGASAKGEVQVILQRAGSRDRAKRRNEL